MSGDSFHPNATLCLRPFLSTLQPLGSPQGGGEQPGTSLQSPCNRHGYATVPEKQEKEEKVSDIKCIKRERSGGGLGCGGIPISVTRSARVHVRRVAKPKTTHTLKMESRDQSADGQVGESERHLMDGGSVEGKRSDAAV